MDSVTVFRDSLRRCLEEPNFLLDFYGTFMASSEEIRQKFKNTDQKRQTEVLADTLWKMAVLVQSQPGSPARVDLARLAEMHSRRHLDIRPGLYDQWLECLVATARRYDPRFSPEIEQAWRETLAVGIEFLRAGY